jgi:class 3 adenylate cyclase
VPPDRRLPDSGRILATRRLLDRLGEEERRCFEPAGEFRLRGFTDPCPLWLTTLEVGTG